MGTIGNLIADAASIAGKYQKRLTTDIPDSLFGRLVVVDGKAIQSNHPAFILGHLSLYPAKAMKLLGLPLGTTLPSDRLESIFSKETSCVDDITGDIYPSKQEIVLFFESSYEVALNAIRNAPDDRLLSENPTEGPIKKNCPTLGSMLAFYMDGHVMMHLGQLSAWRRFQGLPPA